MATTKKPMVPYMYAHKPLIGVMVFLLGAIKYFGYSWEIALMAVGALMTLKGLLMHKCCK